MGKTSNSLFGFHIGVGKLDLGNYFGQLRNWIWEIWVKHTLQTKVTKTVTSHANTQEIITLKEFMTYPDKNCYFKYKY